MKLLVNGTARDVDVPADVPLLWVIREELALTGTKFGCGRALCGACTVLVEGKARRSCVTAVGDVEGKAITTIEGLAEGDELHAVQEAWMVESVPQCGYCQSGQILATAALLKRRPRPSDADVDAVMAASLCRCGTYPRIRKAIARAAESMAKAEASSGDAP